MASLKVCAPHLKSSCDTCQTREESLLCSSPNAQAMMERARRSCQFNAGEIIFHAGTDPKGIFTIRSGLVKLEVSSNTGAAHTLRIVGAGATLGYRSLFAEEPYSASAIAVKDCELCFVPKDQIMEIFKANPELAMKLLSHISKDLRFAETKWMDQMDKGASERIAEALLFLHQHFSSQNWTRREIAQWAGTTPETVIRTLSQFEKEGLIDQTDGRSIRIVSQNLLKEKTSIP